MNAGRLTIGILAATAVAVTSVGVFLTRKSDCRRLSQTAELAIGSEISRTFFGGCRVVTSIRSEISAVSRDNRPAGTSITGPRTVGTASLVDKVARGAASVRTIRQPVTQDEVDAEHSQELAQCLATGDAARGVSVAMGGCVNAELEAQDARLNATYQDVMGQLSNAERIRLRSEQRAWMQRRDDECAAQATGGTIDLVDVPGCRLDQTIRQRLTLEAFAP